MEEDVLHVAFCLLLTGTMEAAIAVHFAVLRKVAAEFGGHESATEVRRARMP
jgi:hypothetical protein